jgi:predicted RNase H-like nuclease (RuvC/YqgF family)
LRNTGRFLTIIERLMNDSDKAHAETVSILKADNSSLRRTVADQEKFLHQYQSELGKLRKQAKQATEESLV